METIDQAVTWLSGLGIKAERVSTMRRKIEKTKRPVVRISNGVSLYEGHDADEAEGLGSCPAFEYAWVRFDLEGDYHFLLQIPLPRSNS